MQYRKYFKFLASLTVAFMTVTVAYGAAAPKITSVVLKATGTTFKATISGKGFGTSPVALPCNGCTIPELTLTDAPSLARAVPSNIIAWTDSKITLTGLSGTAGDAFFLAVKNDAVKNLATWGGNLPVKGTTPKITGVAFSGSGKSLAITIKGTGFGSAPAGIPGTVDVPYFDFLDWVVKKPGQFNQPWGAGGNPQGFTDTVTANYVSWSDTQIVIHGFGGAYGTNGLIAEKNDPFVVVLWQPPGIIAGQTGPQTSFGGRIN